MEYKVIFTASLFVCYTTMIFLNICKKRNEKENWKIFKFGEFWIWLQSFIFFFYFIFFDCGSFFAYFLICKFFDLSFGDAWNAAGSMLFNLRFVTDETHREQTNVVGKSENELIDSFTYSLYLWLDLKLS